MHRLGVPLADVGNRLLGASTCVTGEAYRGVEVYACVIAEYVPVGVGGLCRGTRPGTVDICREVF